MKRVNLVGVANINVGPCHAAEVEGSSAGVAAEGSDGKGVTFAYDVAKIGTGMDVGSYYCRHCLLFDVLDGFTGGIATSGEEPSFKVFGSIVQSLIIF